MRASSRVAAALSLNTFKPNGSNEFSQKVVDLAIVLNAFRSQVSIGPTGKNYFAAYRTVSSYGSERLYAYRNRTLTDMYRYGTIP